MKAVALTLMTSMAMTLLVASPANAEIAWQTNLRTAHAQAQAEGKLLLLHFFTDNCSWCDKLEAGAFKDASVDRAISENFVAVKIHAGQSPKLAEMFKVTKFPTDVVVNTEGKTLSHGVSPQAPIQYVAMLTKALPAATAPPGTMIANNAAPQAPAVSPSGMPSYATPSANPTTAATAAAKPNASAAGWELPSDVPAKTSNTQLVSNQTDGLSLSMPGQMTLPSQTSAPKEAGAPNQSVAVAQTKSSTASSKLASTKPANVPADPELAMEGYCSVTVVDEAKWIEGSPEFGVIHLGKLYLFSSKANMQKFLADPIPYTPILNEIDVVRFFEDRVIVPGKREWAMQDPINRRMFFFSDEAAMLHFENSYERYVDAAITVMQKAVKESNPGT